MDFYDTLKIALNTEIQRRHCASQQVQITCKALSPSEAIGQPDHDDYPIITGREKLVEAVFHQSKGQAFSDAFERSATYRIEEFLELPLDSTKTRASFVAGLNAIFNYFGLCDKTIHCRDAEPVECANCVLSEIPAEYKVLLVGFQPRFLEILATNRVLRVLDLDSDNIGKEINGVIVEPSGMTADAIAWCDLILATGSTLVNGTIHTFLNQPKPVLFYGTTIAAAAKILNLPRYCHRSH